MALTSTPPHAINQLCNVVQWWGTNIAYRAKINTACRAQTLHVEPIAARSLLVPLLLTRKPVDKQNQALPYHNDDDSPTWPQHPSMFNTDMDQMPSMFDSKPWHDNPLMTLMTQHAHMAK
ncbi:hypothetical protein BU15DRAFT_62220 [Melanogaster broomeanus]|nr:hypothetical protein BU15DRAFT_62220 [Melanogaster broomeanus]